MPSYYRRCRYCGRLIQLREMPAGQWVAFEGYGTLHECGSAPVGREPRWSPRYQKPLKDTPTPDQAAGKVKRTLALLEQAIHSREVLHIRYRSEYKAWPEVTERDVEPVQIVGATCEAYCRLRNDFRWFRADRVLSVTHTGEVFRPRARTGLQRPHRVALMAGKTAPKRRTGWIWILIGVGLLYLLLS